MEKYYTPMEVAEHFRLKRTTIWKWLREGYIYGISNGRGYLIPEDEILRIEEEGSIHPGRPALRKNYYIRVDGKPVKVTSEGMPDDPTERAIVWRTFILEHPGIGKKSVTGLPGGLKEEFYRYAAEAEKYEDGQSNDN